MVLQYRLTSKNGSYFDYKVGNKLKMTSIVQEFFWFQSLMINSTYIGTTLSDSQLMDDTGIDPTLFSLLATIPLLSKKQYTMMASR